MKWTMRSDPGGFATRWCDELAARYLSEGHWQASTLVDAARKALGADPDHVLLIEGERRLTRRDSWDQSLRLAAFFLSRGLKPGDVVSFQLPNWVESAVIALAARMTGLVRPVAVFLRLESPVDFEAADGIPVDLVFGLLSPEQAGTTHLHALAAISRLMRDERMHAALVEAPGNEALYGLLCNVIDRDAA